MHAKQIQAATTASTPAPAPARLFFVYNSASGPFAMLADAVKKAAGIEECALCEITHGPLGKRGDWARCERGLGVPIEIVHRDEVPPAWKIDVGALPCVLSDSGDDRPRVLLDKDEIASCAGNADALERLISRRLAGG
jgi:hypothetical protein